MLPYRREFVTVNRQHDGARFHTAIKNEGSTCLMRLFHLKTITLLQRQAGEELNDIWRRARLLYHGSPNPVPKISQMEVGFGRAEDGRTDPVAEKKFRAARIYLRMQSPEMFNEVADVCLYDFEPTKLSLLKEGLSLLVKHFGFTS